MNKKYELIPEDGTNLYRIKALKDFGDVGKGDLGGLISGEHNLSHEGNSWVYDNARVWGNAVVGGNAVVYGKAKVYGNAEVYGKAKICGKAEVYGSARVYGNAKVCSNARVHGNSWVYDNARVWGNAVVGGNAKVCSNTKATKNVVNIIGLSQHTITVTDNHIIIGCKAHTIIHWLINYKEIGEKNYFSPEEIEIYGDYIKSAARQRL